MDNLCHTLAGAAFGEAGLKKKTPLGSATLMIAANLPDIDVLVFATSLPSVAFRRGWTHGIVAQAVLPVALAAVMYWVGRRRGARMGGLILLSYVGVLSHVLMDLLNNYGVRLLMPFSGRWFYGDSVFIVDPWLWLMLGAGTWLAASRGRAGAARVALVAAAVYVAAMVASSRAARDLVAEQWRGERRGAIHSMMVGPMAATPFHRIVIVESGDRYYTGTFSWFTRRASIDREPVPKNDDDPAVRAAIAADARIRAVLTWSRFPYYQVERGPDGDVVTLRDLRFGDRVGGVRAIVAASPGSGGPADRSR